MQIKTLSLIFLSFLIFCQTTYSAATKADESEKILVPIPAIKEAFAADLEKHTISSWPHQSKELVLEDQKYKASINLGSEVTIPETLERKPFDGPTLGQVLFSLGKNLTLYHAFNARGEYTSPPVWSFKCGFDATPTPYKEGTIEKVGYGRWGSLELRYSQINAALIEASSDDESAEDKAPRTTYLTDFYISLTKA